MQRVPEDEQDTIRIERFFEEIVSATPGRFDGGFDGAMSADHDDHRMWIDFADLAERLEAVHARHLDVHERQIGEELPEDRDCFRTTRRGSDLMPFVIEELGQYA